jgi:hypothetical protein
MFKLQSSEYPTGHTLANQRQNELETCRDGRWAELEQTYGNFCLLPYDVPIIKPLDTGKWLEWWDSRAQLVTKLALDISGVDVNPDHKIYSIDNFKDDHLNWGTNLDHDIEKEFPELFEQIAEYLPWNMDTVRWSVWSSIWAIPWHRDSEVYFDMPVSMRIKLYDDNPTETLMLRKCPKDQDPTLIRFKLPEESNTFAWNNLRVEHGSIKFKKHKKMLMIFHYSPGIKWNKLADILDRSVNKYKNYAVIDQLGQDHYL